MNKPWFRDPVSERCFPGHLPLIIAITRYASRPGDLYRVSIAVFLDGVQLAARGS